MAIARLGPLDDILRLRDSLSLMLDDRFSPILEGRAYPVDVFETAEYFHIEVVLPGAKLDDIHVTATSSRLVIQTRIQESPKSPKGSYLRQERTYGDVTRVLELPADIQPEKVVSLYEYGVLVLNAPKSDTAKPHQVTVQIKETS